MALAVIVGHFKLADGFADAYKYFTFNGYAFFTALRLIPYSILGVIVLTIMNRKFAQDIACGCLFGIVAMIVLGSWFAQRAFYTGEHVSSTTALDFLIIPFEAIVTGIIGALTGWVIHFIIADYKGKA